MGSEAVVAHSCLLLATVGFQPWMLISDCWEFLQHRLNFCYIPHFDLTVSYVFVLMSLNPLPFLHGVLRFYEGLLALLRSIASEPFLFYVTFSPT